jgi:hypothetical protein
MFILQGSFESSHGRGEGLGVLRRPALEDQANGDRIQEMELLAPGAARGHQVRALEHAQVLHGPEAAHAAVTAQLGEGLSVAREQPVEQAPSGAVGQRLEDLVHCVRY